MGVLNRQRCIAFNGVTWYEKHFHARYQDPETYRRYREKVDQLLYSRDDKSHSSFGDFLRTAKPPTELVDELQSYYEDADTLDAFFQAMPKTERCRLVRDWITTFMSAHLKGVFTHTDWVIVLGDGDKSHRSGGTGGWRASRRRTRRYYCPNQRIMAHKETYHDVGAERAGV